MSILSVDVNSLSTKVPIEDLSKMLEVIGGLKDQLNTIQGTYGEYDTVDLLDKFVSGDPSITQAIDSLVNSIGDITGDEINTVWSRLRTHPNDDRARKFLLFARRYEELDMVQYADLPRSVEVNLIDFDKAVSRETVTDKASVAVEFSAEAEATLRVDILGTTAQQATSNKPVLPSGVIKPIPTDKALLKIGLDGKVKVGGGLAFSEYIQFII